MRYTRYNIAYPKPGCPDGEDVIYVDKNLFIVIDGVGGSSKREGRVKDWTQCRDYILYFIEVLKMFNNQYKDLKLHDLMKYTLYYCGNRTKYQGTFVFSMCRLYEGYMDYCTLGDCTIVVRRKDRLVLKNKHDYVDTTINMPRQMGLMNGKIIDVSLKTKRMKIKKGDVIILCSDGITDNISLRRVVVLSSAYKICSAAKKANKKYDDMSVIRIEI